MNFQVKDGELRIDIEALTQDPQLARAVAKQIIFDEALLVAITSLALTGECDWEDGSMPWYILGCHSAGFERLRARIAEVAPEAAKSLVADVIKQRDRINEQMQAYQTRAWQAENFVRQFNTLLGAEIRNRWSTDELNMLARICNRPAHAEIGGAS